MCPSIFKYNQSKMNQNKKRNDTIQYNTIQYIEGVVQQCRVKQKEISMSYVLLDGAGPVRWRPAANHLTGYVGSGDHGRAEDTSDID